MKAKQFLELLENHSEKELVFEYEAAHFVPNAYHITEVKNLLIESVDCGGRAHTFRQTVVQLWISNKEKKEEKSMLAGKALKIFNKVNEVKPIHGNTDIFFEWGHGDLRTSNYEVTKIEESADRLTVQMFVPPTVCKPRFELTLAGANSSGGCC